MRLINEAETGSDFRRFQLALAFVAGRRQKRLSDLLQSLLAGDFRPQRIGDIESVRRAFTIGGEVRGLDNHVGLEQSVSEAIEQSGAVARRHLDHGEAVGGLVVKGDRRRDLERF